MKMPALLLGSLGLLGPGAYAQCPCPPAKLSSTPAAALAPGKSLLPVRPTPLRRAALDSVVAQARLASQVPGLAVAVVQAGRLVLAQGYGVRSLATQEPVDAYTLFDIGSITQSFAAAALGLLVAQGQLC